MFKDLIQIVQKLNQGDIQEAGKEFLELIKDKEYDEELLNISYQIEKELRDLKDDERITLHDSPFAKEFKSIIKEMTRCREAKIKVLLIHGIYKLSNGNLIILNMIRSSSSDIKPNTFI